MLGIMIAHKSYISEMRMDTINRETDENVL